MGWYDHFSRFYDAALEPAYAEHRQLAADALELAPDSVVLDVPCGTGQSFDAIVERSSATGLLLGVDLSSGMLARARERVERHDLRNVCLLEADAAVLDLEMISRAAGRTLRVDRLHIFLGMSLFPDMQSTFARLWSLLEPGGRCAIVDVYADRLGLQGFLVNRIARADIRRRFWEPLAAVADGFSLRELPFRKEHGGQIMLATGTKRGPQA